MRFVLSFLIVFTCAQLQSQAAIYNSASIHHPIVAENGMVSTQHPIASQVGVDILKQGGNAVDAAVAVGFALAVVLPRAGNLGGGGFMIVYDVKTSNTTAINYREMAPGSAHKDMYLDEQGNVDNDRFNNSYLSIGVPGTVAGLCHALETYGTMSLKEVIKPAYNLAKKGFPVSYDLAVALDRYSSRMQQSEESKAIFYKNGINYKAGETLKQSQLAWSLKQLMKGGKDAFYNGEIANRISSDVQKHGGIITNEDFRNYRIGIGSPVEGSYRGYEIHSMPPPSSGGVHLIQILNILEEYEMSELGHNSAKSIHLLVEAMRLAYADRSQHMGDPDFWEVPVAGLTSKKYADSLRQLVNEEQANHSSDIRAGEPSDYESEETTHYSVVDKWGNAVSNTYTLNFSFGTGLVAEGTGIILNNEMGDFAAKPGVSDAYGLIGGVANAVEPQKRPLSSMTPTIVLKDKKPYIVTGSPGGSRIITTVLQIILNTIDHDMNIAESTHAPRIHHQWYPDKLFYENTLNKDTKELLMMKGHTLEQRAAMGSTQSIMIKNGLIYGASDPRRPDGTAIGY